MTDVDIYLAVPDDIGWHPIHRMARLLHSYVRSSITTVNIQESLTLPTRVRSLVPRRRGNAGIAIVIANDPGQLNAIAQDHVWRRRYSGIFGWVIDSFWDDRIPLGVRRGTTFDHIFVTDPQDAEDWSAAGVKRVSSLPWGADVLAAFEEPDQNRSIDLQRVGRQPIAWNDDEYVTDKAIPLGISYRGRTFGRSLHRPSPQRAWSDLVNALHTSKTVLAFSVHDAPANYTHPTKDYLTGRWTDALARGCVVVGSRPDSKAAESVLWEGATVEIDPHNVARGLGQLKDYLSGWTPELARQTQLQALSHLDWRHRFKELLYITGVDSIQLEKDLDRIGSLRSE